MQHPKRTKTGVEERIRLLAKYEPRADMLLRTALEEQRRMDLQADDLLDALVGFVVARTMPDEIERLHGEPAFDEHGLPMEMVYRAAG